MIKIDLVTGFLGSGKTTFIKKYVNYLKQKGLNIGIIENDYGAINVDVMLLENEFHDQVDIEMVAGAGCCDTHKRRFKTKLISLGMLGYDRVIVEPSGIYDVDEFFDTLYEDPLDRWYEIGNVFTILDPHLDKDLSDESKYLLCSQTAKSGKIIFSKICDATNKDIIDSKSILQEALNKFHCKRILKEDDFLEKDWNNLTDNDFETLLGSNYNSFEHKKINVTDENNYNSLFFMNPDMKKDEIISTIKKIMSQDSLGNIFRIKGFFSQNKEWYEVNASKEKLSINQIETGQEVIIIIGENLDSKQIKAFFPKAISI